MTGKMSTLPRAGCFIRENGFSHHREGPLLTPRKVVHSTGEWVPTIVGRTSNCYFLLYVKKAIFYQFLLLKSLASPQTVLHRAIQFRVLMKDTNICENCNHYLPFDCDVCAHCEQPMVLDSTGKLGLWRLGDIRDGILGHIAHELRLAFQFPVLIQPAYLDERPSARPTWKGLSSSVFLEQVHRRHSAGTFVSLGITEANIVPDARHNFLFGYAYLGLPAAVISLHAMEADAPTPDILIMRAALVAVHEIGHTLGLEHHSYESGVNCVMVGDAKVDSIETLDGGTSQFCEACRLACARFFQHRAVPMAPALPRRLPRAWK